MTMSSPTGAAARKNRPPASLVAHRSFAIPAVDVDLQDDRLQTADARGDQDTVGSPGEERDIDTQRVGAPNRAIGGIDQDEVAGDHQAVAADGFDHGHDVAGR